MGRKPRQSTLVMNSQTGSDFLYSLFNLETYMFISITNIILRGRVGRGWVGCMSHDTGVNYVEL